MSRQTAVTTQYKLALFLFRRDLRLDDNLGLISALGNAEQVVPAFIFDTQQCETNSYKSPACIQFMLESLQDLQEQLKEREAALYFFYGNTTEIVEQIVKTQKVDAIYVNRDYTPFSQQRDQSIAALCQKYSIAFESYDDALLNPPELTLKSDGTPYQIFTRFYEHVRQFPISTPKKNQYKNYFQGKIDLSQDTKIFQKILPTFSQDLAETGGRRACLKKLSGLKNIKNYSLNHDYPSLKATSGLSAHLKFTTCSVREIYYAIKKSVLGPESILRELYWRDFFTMIAFYFPHVFGHAFRRQYDSIAWKNDKKTFQAWCQGQTGFPIVDAGMRELNQTGFMHNRVRLITASFLVKDLHIDWRWGEKYFAQQLMDYDPAVNNGNWQWVAGTGTDAQPYFRIFNPWLQQKKFDAECLYIKKWVPELSEVDPKIIHGWYKRKADLLIQYPVPIVDHSVEAERAKRLYAEK